MTLRVSFFVYPAAVDVVHPSAMMYVTPYVDAARMRHPRSPIFCSQSTVTMATPPATAGMHHTVPCSARFRGHRRSANVATTQHATPNPPPAAATSVDPSELTPIVVMSANVATTQHATPNPPPAAATSVDPIEIV
ncbi:hypothetical protein BN1723_015518 [Verticillium longisporum]|uniref:Uncharacterized protein n=1 Tax=Verticillium longisporum TaxID=100787 RepID=A0A0G4MZE6_VERLO|nr:hypothetical protein BN1723_015518 [Verticillium longisporum]